MEAAMTLITENQLFSAHHMENIALIRLKGGLLRHLTNLNVKESWFRYLHDVRLDNRIRVILVIGSPDKLKRKSMFDFLCDMANSPSPTFEATRVYNAINQLILFMRSMDKLVIHADSGEVLSLFLNMSLACDYRIISDKTVFQYPTQELGMVPKGGGIYFMSRLIGPSKTLEVLLAGKDISATEALGLGLVDRLVPQASIEDEAIAMASMIAGKPAPLIAGIKKLLVAASGSLSDFLEKENALLLDRFRNEDFQQQLMECR
jgi:2-(1,2-epoxy-1,2-dihydrophenyl)acetyl-CoA isomerase